MHQKRRKKGNQHDRTSRRSKSTAYTKKRRRRNEPIRDLSIKSRNRDHTSGKQQSKKNPSTLGDVEGRGKQPHYKKGSPQKVQTKGGGD